MGKSALYFTIRTTNICSIFQMPLQEVQETDNNQQENNDISASENVFAEPLAFGSNAAAPQQEQIPVSFITEPGPSGIQLKEVIHELTPNKKNNTNCSMKSTNTADPTIPSPFKRVLFWPDTKPQTSKGMKKEKIPCVLTSPQTIMYYRKKEEDKQQKAENQAKRKEEREQKRKELQEKKESAEEQKKKKQRQKKKRHT